MKAVNPVTLMIYPMYHDLANIQMDLIEFSARTCYDSIEKMRDDTRDSAKFFKGLIKMGHESPLEHATASFLIHCSRAVLAQLTRHRLASFSVQSQRYVNQTEKEGLQVIVPEKLTHSVADMKDFEESIARAEADYNRMIDCGITKEDARTVLPECTATLLVMTANLREWRHILQLRTSARAYPETRVICTSILDSLYEFYPPIFEDIYNTVHKDKADKAEGKTE